MKKKILIGVSIVVLILIALIVSARIANTPTKNIIIFEKPEGYKEVIDNSVDPTTIQSPPNRTETTSNENKQADPSDVMLGTWTGEMSGKKLTIVIEKVNRNELEGYNQLGTNKRALKGIFVDGEWPQSCSKAFDATLNEPGDDKWDGVFSVKFVGYGDTNDETNECLGGKYQGTEAQGVWKSNNGKMKKDFTLTRQK